MMWNYGAGNHSAEQYQQLMMRLNTGMTMENPKWYNNYEKIWWEFSNEPSNHAHDERDILNTLIDHTTFHVSNPKNWDRYEHVLNTVNKEPNKIYIFWHSAGWEYDFDSNPFKKNESVQNLAKSKNFILFWAWSNTYIEDWNLKNKIYQEDIETNDIHWIYAFESSANWKNDNILDRHIIVTIGTNKYGNVDITNKWTNYLTSKFPVWFNSKVLFAWRSFPFYSAANKCITADAWDYATSYVNYVNVAMADLCFQMFAEVKDVDELLEMIRSTTLTDYIRLDWETQQLQLINPAWFFQKYLMPTDIPNNLKPDKTTPLNKWYYKWVIFNIPWAEVKIDWQWIVYNDANKSLIKSQNPMTLEWRVNWNLCKKLWYKWKNIKWKVIVVDEKWNGLNIDKDFSISIQ